MIKVGLVDNNELFRESLHFLIDNKTEMEVDFSSSSLAQLRIDLKPGMLDVVLLEVAGFDEDDKFILKQLVHNFPEVRFVVLSNSISKALVSELIHLRIDGFYSKNTCIESLESGINEMFIEKSTVGIKLGSFVQDMLINKDLFQLTNTKVDSFSERELEVLYWACKELTNVEIANNLGLSVRTIETHRRRMIERTQSKSIVGVIMFAFANSIRLNGQHIENDINN